MRSNGQLLTAVLTSKGFKCATCQGNRLKKKGKIQILFRLNGYIKGPYMPVDSLSYPINFCEHSKKTGCNDMNFHVESSLAFQFQTKVVISNLETSLHPRHLRKKHGTLGSKCTLAIWHCVGKVSAFPLNPFFFLCTVFHNTIYRSAELRMCHFRNNSLEVPTLRERNLFNSALNISWSN